MVDEPLAGVDKDWENYYGNKLRISRPRKRLSWSFNTRLEYNKISSCYKKRKGRGSI